MTGKRSEALDAGLSKYRKIRDLNSGTFGKVQLALDRATGELVALKFMEKSKITRYAEREILNHRKLAHPHVIQFKEAFLTTNHLVIAMEYAPGGDLLDYVVQRRGLTEPHARRLFQQTVVAVDYCHKMGVACRDIKLENVLLDSSPLPLVKLCDFGYSKDEAQSPPESRVGTLAYLAPEVITNTKGSTYDAKRSDVWSAGVMLFVMLTARYPFEGCEDTADPDKARRVVQRILRAQYQFPPGLAVSGEVRDLLARMLVADPSRRITISGILEHPWYNVDLPPGVKQMNDDIMKQHHPGTAMEVE